MSKSKINVPQAKEALNQFKMEAAKEVGIQSLINEIIQHIVQPMAIKSI
ncbi:MAG: small, acid-soluble spore protein, alpha/beta type [Clostridia bacterium]|nr:small, acid-soluble spore protein, alpha/beta type [Clostridia bacterium]